MILAAQLARRRRHRTSTQTKSPAIPRCPASLRPLAPISARNRVTSGGGQSTFMDETAGPVREIGEIDDLSLLFNL
jgi:hypothetical protein